MTATTATDREPTTDPVGLRDRAGHVIDQIIAELIASGEQFTSEDVWQKVPRWVTPYMMKLLTPRINAARRSGAIEKVAIAYAQRASSHRGYRAVWRKTKVREERPAPPKPDPAMDALTRIAVAHNELHEAACITPEVETADNAAAREKLREIIQYANEVLSDIE